MSLRLAVSRSPVSVGARALSTQTTQAVSKLRNVLEEYRQANYTQELPSRFKKDIVRAASQDRESIIALQDVQRVLQNIGADNRLTSEEIRSIFQEIGNKSGEMTVQHFMQIL
ncbi:predicted protein [Phaeodactylum tricornutum CCAP 1055/1]|jgi:4-hydroxy-3-methylbut-2-enyl diphosphate reductase IspH|uniref:Uncharacterized protein n=2 Tax=Phaeodactylum tricornutum TaxID=2850 RepID=B7FSW5_PHATC|nr:predicted protein [Phaeodactylum tricornutum CCAP 1055/1]EEC50550.1 predicted protein [Phaeodactylum tricornutum CCAP 1055/1]|eukprot:XP_002177736.1 predicted protein [Phaeodactylum tricornutum CCAP 1055/1]